jgi:hypothetical protein
VGEPAQCITATRGRQGAGLASRSISSSLSKVDIGVHVYEEAMVKRASLQAMRSKTARR